MNAGTNPDKNFIILRRQNNIVSLQLRDERDFFGSPMTLNLSVASNGHASGTFSGNFGIDTDTWFGFLEFGSINMSYSSTSKPYQFQMKTRLIGADWGLYFGSGGTGFCHLNCPSTNSSIGDCDATGLVVLPPDFQKP